MISHQEKPEIIVELKLDDYSFRKTFGLYHNNPNNSDLIIWAGFDHNKINQVPFFAHKFMLKFFSLAAFSKKWSQILYQGDSFSDEDNYMDIHFRVDPKIMDSILTFCYTGKIQVTDNEILSILNFCSENSLENLKSVISEYMKQSVSKKTASKYLEVAYQLECQELYDYVYQFILKNISNIIQEPFFIEDISETQLLKLTHDDSLQIDELTLFNLCINWGLTQIVKQTPNKMHETISNENNQNRIFNHETSENLKHIVTNLLENVRFPLISASDLVQYVVPTRLLTNDRLVEAFVFQNSDFNDNSNECVQYRHRVGNLMLKRNNTLLNNINYFECSTILEPKEHFLLNEFYEKQNQYWTLIYKGTVHGFNCSNFHEKCDNAGSTMIIIKVKETGYVFGGFTNAGWNCTDLYARDPTSFLFSLRNSLNGQSFRLIFNPFKNDASNYAIRCYGKKAGAVFGNGHDIYISSDCSTQNNYCRPMTFTLPENTIMNPDFLPGINPFTVEDIECFSRN